MSMLLQEIFPKPVFRKFSIFAIALMLAMTPGCNSGHQSSISDNPGTNSSSKSIHDFELVDVFEVEGRQGIATDGEYYYVSGSKALYKYSKDGELLLKNESPFVSFDKPANHLGDIDVYNDEIYAGGEMFADGRGENIQIAVYDAETLQYKRSMNWNPDSGQVEVSGITVDTNTKTIWMTDWVNGRYIYQYDLQTGDYLRKLRLQPVPQYQQGIFYWDDYLYITADDGDADFDEPDNLYRVSANTSSTVEQVMLEKTFIEFKRAGEIEGLTVDPVTNEFLVLFNRGTRIVLGMPKGFYEGYDREIHEVYRYLLKKK